jgi:hypothetical protein
MKQAPPPMYESHNMDSLKMKSSWHTLSKPLEISTSARIVGWLNSKFRNPHKSSHCSMTRSKTRLKRRNKIITNDIIGHLLKHNVLKSFSEDRKDESRAIVRFVHRGMRFLNWNDIGILPDKRKCKRSKDKRLSKHRKNQ